MFASLDSLPPPHKKLKSQIKSPLLEAQTRAQNIHILKFIRLIKKLSRVNIGKKTLY